MNFFFQNQGVEPPPLSKIQGGGGVIATPQPPPQFGAACPSEPS